MGVREYLPSLGRWLSADTIVPRPGDPQAFNRFSYVRNSPIGRIDPSGHGDCNSHQKPRCNGEGIEKPAFANSRKVHTLKAGIIDRAHVELFRTKALEILTFVRGAIGSTTSKIGKVEYYNDTTRHKVELNFEIAPGLKASDASAVALSIFMKFSEAYETLQEEVGIGSSAFSQEDLPSNLIGFYAAERDLTAEQAIEQFGGRIVGPDQWQIGPAEVTPPSGTLGTIGDEFFGADRPQNRTWNPVGGEWSRSVANLLKVADSSYIQAKWSGSVLFTSNWLFGIGVNRSYSVP
jgi:hypothetical protein